MGRWQPGTKQRLQAVALELLRERGCRATTVGDIASRAQVTEQTLYRYFADKRGISTGSSRPGRRRGRSRGGTRRCAPSHGARGRGPGQRCRVLPRRASGVVTRQAGDHRLRPRDAGARAAQAHGAVWPIWAARCATVASPSHRPGWRRTRRCRCWGGRLQAAGSLPARLWSMVELQRRPLPRSRQ